MTNNQTNKKYAVVTGASKGLGKEFALELARRKINLLLVSLPNEGLAKVAEEVKKKYRQQRLEMEEAKKEPGNLENSEKE